MTIHAPVPDYAAARASMVETQLRPEGVNYPPVVEAMAAVKREDFVAEEVRPLAYIDRTVPIGDGRLMSPPVVVGALLGEMMPALGERALVVGCGTGYSCAVLEAIGLKVLGLECSPALASRARALGTQVVEGPLEAGWAQGAPYDLILIDGAIEHIPEAIVSQLTGRGRLGAALIDRGVCRLTVGRRAGDGFGLHTLSDAGAAALPGFARPRGFTF
jgi:protein-L-isoaspartate(D-aspartate) O-methyltransferase